MTDDLKAPERIWAFDRYVNGVLMAEGVTVTRASSFEEACVKATKLASRGPNNEAPVLVLAHRDAEHIATLEAALADAQKERDTAREWLGAANNEFGSAAWDWPDLWRRIAQLKDLSNERWQRAEKAEVALAETEALEEQHGAMIQRLCGELADMTQQRDAAMAGAVKVKPLVWHEGDEPDEWKSGPYNVWCECGKFQLYHWAIIMGDPQKTADAAKAAAQRDYEARIMSALTPDPDRLLALTAAAYGDAAAVIEDNVRHAKELGREIWAIPDLRTRIPSDALAALSRIEAQAEARGMRKAGELVGSPEWVVPWELSAKIEALADATEAAAKGGV